MANLLGDPNARRLQRYRPLLDEINGHESVLQSFSDDELRALTAEFRQDLAACGGNPDRERQLLDALLPKAYALVREGSRRVLGLRHHDVQLLGGIVLHHGNIAEMQTGEGKTLVSTLPVFLNALTGRGVHAITANDYLARRDAELMGQVHRFLGLTVGLIQASMQADERRRNYACDVTYATNAELGFDYLRDNMAGDLSQVVQRPPYYCVIDEVDSILIDEARTPLIISGKVERPQEKFIKAAAVAAQLERASGEADDEGNEPEGDYEVDEKQRNCNLTEAGFAKAEQLLGVQDLFNPADPWAHFINNALKAKELFSRDRHYIVRQGEVVIVDENTGRVMAGRRWGDGQHQAIEAKEGVPILPESQTLASITYQNFFRLYARMAGMTGTGRTEAAEFEQTYDLEVLTVPTHRPSRRIDQNDQVFKTEQAKWNGVASAVADMHQQGRPVLVGTTSVEKSQVLSQRLSQRGIPHKLLNARPENVEREAEIVAQAGRIGAVTIATNMAGRGTDIIMGGNSDFMARLKLRELMVPLLLKADGGPPPPVIGEEAGFYPCPLSDTTTAALTALLPALVEAWGSQSLSLAEIEEAISQAAEKAPPPDGQIAALREAINQVKADYAAVLKPEGERVREAGGLHVIGTERHDSRRVDNQLRGRAGRQGDPGSTCFFLSLEDELMRLFGGAQVSKLMDSFSLDEEQAMQSAVLSKALASAQRKVETQYYDQRKQVFDYDEVMNNQRQAIYTERRRALQSQDSKGQVLEYGIRTITALVESYANPDLRSSEWNLVGLLNALRQLIKLPVDLDPQQLQGLSSDDIREFLCEQLRIAYDVKEALIEQQRPGLMRQVERFFVLQQIDTLWREHLQAMSALRDSVNLRTYAQKDPLVEYKNEGYDMFLEMMERMRLSVIQFMFAFQPKPQPQPQAQAPAQQAAAPAASTSAASTSAAPASAASTSPEPAQSQPPEAATPAALPRYAL